jgi:hypothetical protein
MQRSCNNKNEAAEGRTTRDAIKLVSSAGTGDPIARKHVVFVEGKISKG